MISATLGKLKNRNRMSSDSDSLTIIQPKSSWVPIDFQEISNYRDLFYFLIWRDLKAFYAQTIMGFLWAIIQPAAQIVTFALIFGKIAKLPTDGIPYVLFASVAVVPWVYMSQSMTSSSQSLISGKTLLGKVYFPRIIFPIAPVLSKLVAFGISCVIILCLMLYYHVLPTWNLLLMPLFIILMIFIPIGVGLWLSSLAIRFRDVQQAMPFFIQLLLYSAPIVYSASSIPESYRMIYSINPIVGVIEGFRACLLGIPIPWLYIWPGIITTAVLLISGAFYFKRMERIIVDVI